MSAILEQPSETIQARESGGRNGAFWCAIIARLMLGGVFGYAGWTKLQAPSPFADSIATFQLLPKESIAVIAIGLPVLELALAWLFLTGLRLRMAAFGGGMLFSLFLVAVIQAQARGLVIDCGCFGSHKPGEESVWLVIGRDTLFLVAAIFLWIFESLKGKRENEEGLRHE